MPDLDTLEEAPPARLDFPVLRAFRDPICVRAADETDTSAGDVMEGHFSVFDQWFEINSWMEGHFLERVAPGSFKRTFNAWRSASDPHKIQVLLEHGMDPTVGNKPLGVNESLSEDKTGAAYRVSMFDASYVNDLLPALRSGVYGSSYRFRVIADRWDYEPPVSDHNPDGIPERTIIEQAVSEHGPTVWPANPHATAGLRSTTDDYYAQVRNRNPDAYDQLVRRAIDLRTSPAVRALADGTEPAATDQNDPPNGTRSEPRTPTHARQLLRRLRYTQ